MRSSFVNMKKIGLYAIDNFTSIAFGLLSVSLIAKVYGPENLGMLSLVQGISGLLIVFVTLGLDHFVVRDLSRNPNDSELIGTVASIQFFGWLLYVLISFIILFFMGKLNDLNGYFLIFSIIILQIYLQSSVFGKIYFQAINQPKLIAKSALISRIIAATYIIVLSYLDAPYLSIIVYLFIQAFLQFIILFVGQRKQSQGLNHLSFSLPRAKSLLKECYPMILSGLFFPLFIHLDTLLVAHYLDEKSLGQYAAARTLIFQFIFIGHVVTMAFYPSLSKMILNTESKDYKQMSQGLSRILFLISFALALFTFIFRDWIVHLLYGNKFPLTSTILMTQVWVWIFIIPATLYTRLLVLQGLAQYEFIKSITTAFVSIALNLVLIPRLGIQGASTVALISFFIADYFFYAIFKGTRPIFIVASKSIISILTPLQTIKDIKFVLSRNNT